MFYDKWTSSYDGSAPLVWPVQQWGQLGIDVTGTFTTGGVRLLGSIDNVIWTEAAVYKAGIRMSPALITEGGHYDVQVSGFALLKVVLGDGAEVDINLAVMAVSTAWGLGPGGTVSNEAIIAATYTVWTPGTYPVSSWFSHGGKICMVNNPAGTSVEPGLASDSEWLIFANQSAVEAYFASLH